MAIQDDNTILNKGDLKAYHERIAPMLGGTFMVGTNNSDYYSTGEKVIGVYDGKPLYQKTWTGLSVSTTASSAVALGISVNNLDKYVGYEASGYHSTAASKRVLTSYIGHLFTENATSTTSNFSYYCLYSGVIITDVTLRYTKTTDAAGSANTTPGAYDINFPNTWPANQEIFFGNGVYGQRFTGTFPEAVTPTTTEIATSFQLGSASDVKKLISSGGDLQVTNQSNNTPSFSVGMYGGVEAFSGVVRTAVGNLRLQIGFLPNVAWRITTSNTYDVWVLYTK